MAEFTFQVDLYRRNPGGQIALARNGSAQVVETAGRLPAPGLKQGGQPVTVVRADANGQAIFTTTAWDVTLREAATGYERRLISPDAEAMAIAAGPSIALDEDGRPYFNGAGIPQAGDQDAAVATQVQSGAKTKAALSTLFGGDVAGIAASVAGKADKTAVDAIATKQQSILSTMATTEEISQTAMIGGPSSADITGNAEIPVFVAPYPCRVVSLSLVFMKYSRTADPTVYHEFALRRRSGAASDYIVSKRTSDEAVTAMAPWKFAGAPWNSTNQQLLEGDILTFNIIFNSGPGPVQLPAVATFRVVPL